MNVKRWFILMLLLLAGMVVPKEGSAAFCYDWQSNWTGSGDTLDYLQYGPYCADGRTWRWYDVDGDGYQEPYMLVGETYQAWAKGVAKNLSGAYISRFEVDWSPRGCNDGSCNSRTEYYLYQQTYNAPSDRIYFPTMAAYGEYNSYWSYEYFDGGNLSWCYDKNGNGTYCDTPDEYEYGMVLYCGQDSDCGTGKSCSKPTPGNPLTFVCATIQVTLNVSMGPGGSVTNPGIGSFAYDYGQSVAITAQPAANYHFVNWTGSGAGKVANANAASTTILMDGNYSLQANFAPDTRTLQTGASAGGTVTTPGIGLFTFNYNSTQAIVAQFQVGRHFVNWTGTGVNAGRVANPNSASTTIQMDNNYDVYANFAINVQQLDVSTTSGGTVTGPGLGTFSRDYGTVVNLVAQASTGHHFVNWTGTGVNAGKVAGPNAASTSITMDGDYGVQANFAVDVKDLTVTSTAGGTVTSPGIGNFQHNYGTVVSLVAQQSVGQHFVNWTGSGVTAGAVADPNASSTSITMSGDYDVQANFAVNTYVLNVTTAAGGTVTSPGVGDFGPYDYGTSVGLVAEPDQGFRFVQWTGSGVTASQVADPAAASTTITMTSAFGVQATFELIPTAQLQLLPDVKTVRAGEVFTLNLSIDTVNDLYGHELDVSFDSTRFEVTRVTQGGFLNRGGLDQTFWQAPVINNTTGSVTDIVCVRLTPGVGVTGGGVLAVIEMREKQAFSPPYDTPVAFVRAQAKLSNPQAGRIAIASFEDCQVQLRNAVPVAADLQKTVLEGGAVDITLQATDDDGDGLTYTVVSSSQHGQISGSGANLTYTPDVGYFGADSFTYRANDGQADSNIAAVSITVTAVNDTPSFVKGNNQTVLEDAGAQTVPSWATAISAGPANESGQTLTFETSSDNVGLFQVQPAVASTGTLTYTPAAHANGSATVTVTLKDDGGIANGGVDTSAPQTFTITVTPVNDAPSYTKGANQTVLEDAGSQTVAGWATAISVGPGNESGQTPTFMVTSDNNALFAVQPAIASNGTLTYTPAANANGSATVTVTLMDNAGTTNGGVDSSSAQSFMITVTAVNDVPSFAKGANQTVLEDAGAQIVAGWATAISAGAANESGQTLNYIVTNDNNALFTALPAVTADGTLSFTTVANANGTATVSVTLMDNGGTDNGGVDTSSSQSFSITVTSINDAPSFVKGNNQTVLEDAGAQTVPGWATAISAGPANESGQALTFETGSDNVGLFQVQPAVTSAGTLTYTPAANANGSATVTVTLKDDGGIANGGVDTSAPQTFTITVTPVNDAPTTSSATVNTAEDTDKVFAAGEFPFADVDAGAALHKVQVVTLPLAGTLYSDTNGDGLLDEGEALAAGSELTTEDLTAGRLKFKPTANDNGSPYTTFTFKVNDGTVFSASSAIMSITVNAVNDPPTLYSIGTKVMEKGQTLSFQLGGTDPDGDGLIYGVTGVPVEATLDSGTGLFTWTPGAADVGVHNVVFTVTDDGTPPLGDTEEVLITVRDVLLVCTQGCPYGTIQEAIDSSVPGDVVQVTSGTYRENLWISKSLTLRRGVGLTIPVFDVAADLGASASWLIINGDLDANGAGDGSVVTIVPPAGEEIRVRLENLVLTGGWDEAGGGLLVTAAEGGTADVAVVNTVVALNDATYGGGIAVKADGAGSVVDLKLLNSTVGWNDAGEGGGIYAEGVNSGAVTLDATNQIVWGNRSGSGEDIHIVQDGLGTATGSAAFSDIGGVSFGGDYSTNWSPVASVSNEDPLYANPSLLDLRLLEGSPAIDAGNDVDGLTEDFEGDARPQGTRVDVGADEHTAATAFATLKLTSLNGRERIAAGEPYLITLGAPAGTSGFRVWYSLNGGLKWKTLTPTPLPEATRQLTWQVPLLTKNSTRCLIKIKGMLNGRAVLDKSDKTFTVEVVRMMSPNGKEHLISGDEVPIAWKTYGTKLPVASTQLQYSVNGGSTWKTIAKLQGNPGSYDWTVPAAVVSTGRCRVQVVLRAANGAIVGKDKSDAHFNAGKVLVLAPNGGESIAGGTPTTITWATTPTIQPVAKTTVFTSMNGGRSWSKTVLDGNPGTFSWIPVLPKAPLTKCKIKVELRDAVGKLLGRDISDAPFTVLP